MTSVVAIVGPGCLRQSHKGEKWPQMLGRAIWVLGMLICEWAMVGGGTFLKFQRQRPTRVELTDGPAEGPGNRGLSRQGSVVARKCDGGSSKKADHPPHDGRTWPPRPFSPLCVVSLLTRPPDSPCGCTLTPELGRLRRPASPPDTGCDLELVYKIPRRELGEVLEFTFLPARCGPG